MQNTHIDRIVILGFFLNIHFHNCFIVHICKSLYHYCLSGNISVFLLETEIVFFEVAKIIIQLSK